MIGWEKEEDMGNLHEAERDVGAFGAWKGRRAGGAIDGSKTYEKKLKHNNRESISGRLKKTPFRWRHSSNQEASQKIKIGSI